MKGGGDTLGGCRKYATTCGCAFTIVSSCTITQSRHHRKRLEIPERFWNAFGSRGVVPNAPNPAKSPHGSRQLLRGYRADRISCAINSPTGCLWRAQDLTTGNTVNTSSLHQSPSPQKSRSREFLRALRPPWVKGKIRESCPLSVTLGFSFCHSKSICFLDRFAQDRPMISFSLGAQSI